MTRLRARPKPAFSYTKHPAVVGQGKRDSRYPQAFCSFFVLIYPGAIVNLYRDGEASSAK
jgi:hypothetical protein